LGGLVAMSLPLNPLKGTYKEFTSDVYIRIAVFEGNGIEIALIGIDPSCVEVQVCRTGLEEKGTG